MLGFTVDTNAGHIAKILSEEGIGIARRTTVGDSADAIASAVGDALSRTGAVITTGGLGPTSDDMTKASIARLFGREMLLDEVVLSNLKARWERHFDGREMPASNRVQAEFPRGAHVIENSHGSAPGVWIEDENGRWVAMLPGVPREMKHMLSDGLLPLLRSRSQGDARVIVSRSLRTTGIGESALADVLGNDPLGLAAGPVGDTALAFIPGTEGVELRVTVRGLPRDQAAERLEKSMERLRSKVGEHAYAENETRLSEVVLGLLRQRGLTLAVAESCTGGLVGEWITAVPGSSDVFLGGVVAYHDAAKTSMLGVGADVIAQNGAVSEQVAREMAEGARARFGASHSIGVTGVAGPGGGTEEKPVGTVWIAMSTNSECVTRKLRLIGNRTEIRERSAQAALDMLRRALQRI